MIIVTHLGFVFLGYFVSSLTNSNEYLGYQYLVQDPSLIPSSFPLPTKVEPNQCRYNLLDSEIIDVLGNAPIPNVLEECFASLDIIFDFVLEKDFKRDGKLPSKHFRDRDIALYTLKNKKVNFVWDRTAETHNVTK